MALKIRLARAGSKKRPYYHIVVADVRSPRDGRFIEALGLWNPLLSQDSEALRAELAKDGVDVLVICPGLTQTNFSQNMIEQKARLPMDHLRGMSPQSFYPAFVIRGLIGF